MALFQKSIVEKYLRTLDDAVIEQAYENYSTVYVPKINRIKELKEEQYQTQFLQDIFGSVLGYTVDPEEGFNIELEKKNEKDSKKVDGAILKDDSVLGVIELKSTKTTDLEKVKDQAFGYKNNHKGCKYVISSNFHKLRFYVDDATEYEEFDLFNLSKTEFRKFYLYLRKEGLLDRDVPKQLKEETKFHEENISKQLYKDYSTFKNRFFENIVKNNPQRDKLILFKKSQKFLDRILFVLFAEDKDLIPENAISRIVESWAQADDLQYKPLYDLFKIFFGHLNVGHKYKKTGYEIPAYNGGLFAPDEILDNIIVDDEVLKDDLLVLSKYDFNSEVDVNILGHIFEHSLSEIEEVEAELRGEVSDKSKSKRKKDGVFYTPKYITKYIVDNTINKLCLEKRDELGIIDEEYAKGRKNRKKETIITLSENLEDYRNWLLNITICDPACGSGAFLNQALEFLIKEHQYIDELESQLLESPIVFNWVEDHILEKNLFGVDINEESVEIARLSLWLRTAKKGRKLTALNNNIKCGNSLIDDPTVVGDKAFKWEEEFPEVFSKGGFDVVIGNPPYVRKQGLMEHYPELCEHYESKFQSATGNYDIYALFMEHSYHLINDHGIVSFILPHKFLVADFGVGIRQFFTDKKVVESILHFESEMVFADAATYTCIINLNKKVKNEVHFKKIKPIDISQPFDWECISYKNLTGKNWDLQSEDVYKLIQNLKKQKQTIDDVFDRIFVGIQTGADASMIFEGQKKGEYIEGDKNGFIFEIEEEAVRPIIKGNELQRYMPLKPRHYVLFPYEVDGEKTYPLSFTQIEQKYPKAARYYRNVEAELRQREKGRFDNEEEWFLYTRKQGVKGVEKPKIMTQEISFGCNLTYDEEGKYYHATTIYSFIKNERFKVHNKFYLGILNSKVMWFFLKNTGTELRGGYFRFKTNYLKPFPLPDIPADPERIIQKVEKIIDANKVFDEEISKVGDFMLAEYRGVLLTKKLETWYEMEVEDFLKELNKAVKKAGLPTLSKEDQIEWTSTFKKYKERVIGLKADIDRTDREIDRMVYELYGLTEEEIKIIEEN